MSYILEALKKAERERDVGAVPSIITQHIDLEPESKPHWKLLGVGVAAVNVILLAAVAIILLNDQERADISSAVVNSPDRPAQVALAPPPPPLSASVSPAQEVAMSEEPVVAPAITERMPVSAEDKGRESVPQEPVGTASNLASNVDLKPNSEMQLAKVTLPSESTTEMSESMTEIPSMEESIEDTEPVEEELVPTLYELSSDFKQSVPTFELNVHVYAEQEQRRFVLMDMKKYREGDRLPNGIFLEEIRQDGLVLDFRGVRFRVPKE